MSTSSFPTTLADLHFENDESNNIYKTLRSLRKSTLGIPNRLKSVLSDARFVETLHETLQTTLSDVYIRGNDTKTPSWPLIANERCGSWYIPPSIKGGSAYFKSTDGHYGRWDFSLRRLNLQILEALGSAHGAMLVDSTRRGKEFPDALRRTVPIWIAVWNRILFPEDNVGEEGLHDLQVKSLEASEVSQINGRLPGFVVAVKDLGLDLEGLKEKLARPVKCLWIVHGEPPDDVLDEAKVWLEKKYNVLILCSASRRVLGAEMSEDGYIQGAGDDSEGWSQGLTAQLFWKYQNLLADASEEDLPDLIEELVQKEKASHTDFTSTLVRPTSNIYIAANSQNPTDSQWMQEFGLVVVCDGAKGAESSKVLYLECREGKLGSKDLRGKLQMTKGFVQAKLKQNANRKILITCSSGRDFSVGVAVMLLCIFFDDKGVLEFSGTHGQVDKQFTKRRLAWITSSKSDANPSRATLQAVNSFLMERPD